MLEQHFKQLVEDSVVFLRQARVNAAIDAANSDALSWKQAYERLYAKAVTQNESWQAHSSDLQSQVELWQKHAGELKEKLRTLEAKIHVLDGKVLEVERVMPALLEGLIARAALERVRRELPGNEGESIAEAVDAIHANTRSSYLPVLERFGFAYVGDCLDGRRHGKGWTRTNEGEYEGEWKDDQMCGWGVFSYSNGERYEGSFRAGKFHGKGVLEARSSTYDGEWEDGAKCGVGVLIYGNGDKYEGSFRGDKYHGKGSLRTESNTYEGEWEDGRRCGFGVLTRSNGEKYEGGFRDDQYHGKGSLFTDSYRYIGEWHYGTKYGSGALVYDSGLKFEGSFHIYGRGGTGEITYPNGDRAKGDWGKGIDGMYELIRGTYWRKEDGLSFEGEFTNGRPKCGAVALPDGSKWDGEVSESFAPNGVGEMLSPDGIARKGPRNGSTAFGEGVVRWPNGDEFHGDWGHAAENEERFMRGGPREVAKGYLVHNNGHKKSGELVDLVFKESLVSRLWPGKIDPLARTRARAAIPAHTAAESQPHRSLDPEVLARVQLQRSLRKRHR